ncbi:protein-disulfide isomerase [Sphingomonas sp. Leaf412]|uniref:thioredoxin domain-containing protein n=1 Tax=Sphingomonas sp. Leaf412 TaxID=1736370 RepID=UPI0006F6C1EA|nr:thioredoxin domain-containing protein [Sphingomonas sp. Leaf412]KQT32863.1 protein-disulfide isomerase [Sphingomonas sp. Leaf412]
MKLLTAALLPLALLAGCGEGKEAPTAPANSVAAVAAPAGQDWTQTVSATEEGGYVVGNPDAPLKLVEWGSRLCPTCGAFATSGMEPLMENYVKTGKVAYEFREFLVHGAPDFAPALIGRCGGAQPFFPMLEEMMAAQATILPKMEDAGAFQQGIQNQPPAQQFTAWAEKLGYIDFAKQRGLPEAQVRACLTDQKAIDALVKYMEAGSNAGVTGTPSFFLNGKKLDAVSWPQVEEALKTAGA